MIQWWPLGVVQLVTSICTTSKLEVWPCALGLLCLCKNTVKAQRASAFEKAESRYSGAERAIVRWRTAAVKLEASTVCSAAAGAIS